MCVGKNLVITPQGLECETEDVNNENCTRESAKRLENHSLCSPTPVELELFFQKIYEKIEQTAKMWNIQYESACPPLLFEPCDRLLTFMKLFGLPPFYADGKYLLPPASDFGIFSMLADREFAKEDLPFRVFVKALCFRKEDKNDGMARLQAFHLPDFHTLLDERIVENEIMMWMKFNALIISDIPYSVAVRITAAEYEKRLPFLKEMAKELNTPIKVNVLEDTIRYWSAKWKYLYHDSRGKTVQLSTVQLDNSTPELFGLKNVKAVIHATPGSMERIYYAFKDLENIDKSQREFFT